MAYRVDLETEEVTAELSHLIRHVPEGEETVFDLLDQAGKSVRTVEIRRRVCTDELPGIMPEQPIARAQARSHTFNSAEAFVAYLKREANPSGSVVLADVERREIVAVLDEKIREDREEVTFKAMTHPLFVPWEAILNRAVDITEFALFVMKHRRAVLDPEGRELALTLSQVKMSKAITVQTGVGRKAINGVVVAVDIAGERRDTPVELPETITISVPLFVGTEPRDIEIDLLVTAVGERVVVYATAADVEEQRIESFEEIAANVAEDTGQLVGLGRIDHRPWEVLPFQS